jgi:hypothetical protein
MFDVVVAAVEFPSHGIHAGDAGTIVDVYPDGELEIEFADENGETTALFSVSPSQIIPKDLQRAA